MVRAWKWIFVCALDFVKTLAQISSIAIDSQNRTRRILRLQSISCHLMVSATYTHRLWTNNACFIRRLNSTPFLVVAVRHLKFSRAYKRTCVQCTYIYIFRRFMSTFGPYFPSHIHYMQWDNNLCAIFRRWTVCISAFLESWMFVAVFDFGFFGMCSNIIIFDHQQIANGLA